MKLHRLSCGLIACSVIAAIAPLSFAQETNEQLLSEAQEQFATAKVIDVISEHEENDFGFERIVQNVRLRIASGPEEGTELEVENGILDNREDMRLTEGETVVLNKQTFADGSSQYQITEKYRLPAIFWLAIIFIGITLLFGGITGITSLAGLMASVVVLIAYVIPRIVAGDNPLTVSIVGSGAIALSSIYLAHGFSRRTSVALLSTLVTLALSAITAVIFVHFARLFGMGSEETLYMQTGMLHSVNLKGLLLGGIIIGSLGVLDDITTAQTAAIDEISKANSRMSFVELKRAGQSVGKEHIASLINTLALAYVGASLPLLLLFKTQSDYPLWVTLNSEFLAEEIIRTLVGSVTLVLAVPISTALAAYFLQGGKGGGNGSMGHSHTH